MGDYPFDVLLNIKDYLIENKDIMEVEGLQNIYVNETAGFLSVIIILKTSYKKKSDFWREIRELIRKSGADSVSTYVENSPRLRLNDNMKKVI